MKVPAIVATGVICLAVGVGLGVAWKPVSEMFEPIPGRSVTNTPPEANNGPPTQTAPAGPPGGGRPGGGRPGGPGGGGPGGGGPGGGGPGGGRPNSKAQLASLGTKINQLT